MTEVWKDIRDFEGLYQISNLGRIKSLQRYVRVGGGGFRPLQERIISPVKCLNGYLEANLNKNGKRYVKLLHRVVAEAFLPNPHGYPQINHKDEDLTNCAVDNLEWCTAKYNANYGTRNVRMMENREFKPVDQYDKYGNFIKHYDKITDATNETGADTSAIIRVCKGKQHTSLGYVWKYSD